MDWVTPFGEPGFVGVTVSNQRMFTPTSVRLESINIELCFWWYSFLMEKGSVPYKFPYKFRSMVWRFAVYGTCLTLKRAL